MSKQKEPIHTVNTTASPSPKADTRRNISTADDVNVDKCNAVESPKKSLTANELDKPER